MGRVQHIRRPRAGPGLWAELGVCCPLPVVAQTRVCTPSTPPPSNTTALSQEKYVRIQANVFLHATTEFLNGKNASTATRDDVRAKVTYLANVSPGGWAPASVVKAVSKREYPKVLRNMSSHAAEKHKSEPLRH